MPALVRFCPPDKTPLKDMRMVKRPITRAPRGRFLQVGIDAVSRCATGGLRLFPEYPRLFFNGRNRNVSDARRDQTVAALFVSYRLRSRISGRLGDLSYIFPHIFHSCVQDTPVSDVFLRGWGGPCFVQVVTDT